MIRVAGLDEIKLALADLDLLPAIEAGFVAYSEGRANVPPVGELTMDKGEVHIKYGCIEGDPYYVIKVASGFYANPSLGLPSGDGMMLLFSQETGAPVAILLDECYLTDVRTALAGAIAAKHLAPQSVERIGILGTGVQARMQLKYLMPVVDCRDVLLCGRDAGHLATCATDMEDMGFTVQTTTAPHDIGVGCNLIVTTTTATDPLIQAAELRSGTHISCIGSDTPEKQELEAAVLARADLVVADSIPQCRLRGEIFKAMEAGCLEEGDLVEIGSVIAGTAPGRTADDQITIFDSTGVAVQDIMIASSVYEALAGNA
jgi:ornithine cyclodeaminase